MRLTQHNLSKMSKEGKLVYEELRELLKCADLTINSYCKQQKITVTVIMNKIYRETLTLNEFIQVANNIGYSVYAENSEQQIELTTASTTLTYKCCIFKRNIILLLNSTFNSFQKCFPRTNAYF